MTTLNLKQAYVWVNEPRGTRRELGVKNMRASFIWAAAVPLQIKHAWNAHYYMSYKILQ